MHLSLLYLQHWKRWDFVTAFAISGGLRSLCSLFAHKNLVIRMNAICTFVNITAHKDFDWFRSPRGASELKLHDALAALRYDPCFLPGLIANSWSTAAAPPGRRGASPGGAGVKDGKTFPGGCLISLEVNELVTLLVEQRDAQYSSSNERNMFSYYTKALTRYMSCSCGVY